MNKVILNLFLVASILTQSVHAIDYQALAYSLFGVGAASLAGAYYYKAPSRTQDDNDHFADYQTHAQMRAYIDYDLMGNQEVVMRQGSNNPYDIMLRTNQTNNWLISQTSKSVGKLKKISPKERNDLTEKVKILQDHASRSNCDCGTLTTPCPQRYENKEAMSVVLEIDRLANENMKQQAKLFEQRAQKIKQNYRTCLFVGLASLCAAGISWLRS